jgi:ABC-2 type transport system permease protein
MFTATAQSAHQPTAGATRRSSVLTNLLRSEWAKLRSVRSAYWGLFVVVAAIVVIGVGAAIGGARDGAGHVGFDPLSASLGGVVLAQIAVGALGALAVTGEYSTGMIRSTFTAAPQRGTVVVAKAAVVGVAACAVGTAATFVSFLVGQAILDHRGVSLGAPAALRSIIGVGLYLGLLGVFAVGLGTALRRTAGAIAVLFGLIFVLPTLVPLAPSSIRDTVGKFLPYSTGHAIFTNANRGSTLSPWLGLAVFAMYAAAALTLGVVLVRRRDA